MLLTDHHCHLLLGVCPELRMLGTARNATHLAQELNELWQGMDGAIAAKLAARLHDLPLLKHTLMRPEVTACIKSFEASKVQHFNLYTTSLLDARLTLTVLLTRCTNPTRFSLGLGFHPWYLYPDILEQELPELIALYDLLQQNAPKLLAPCWGEVGVEGKRVGVLPLSSQKDILFDFIAATKKRCPNYSFHCVGALSELIFVVNAHRVKGVVHGFSGKVGTAELFKFYGLSLGLGPSILRPEQERKWRSLLSKQLNWQLETDCDDASYPSDLLQKIAEKVKAFRSQHS